MRIDPPSSSNPSYESPTYSSQTYTSDSSQSSIQSIGASSKSTFSLRVLFEDLIGFTLNLFLWPIHGPLILLESMMLIIFLPILLPFLIISAIFEVLIAIFNMCTCNCFARVLYGPKGVSSNAESAEFEFFSPRRR